MKSPKVAIIIVTYNSSEYIGDCLSCLENIDYPKDTLEIIVVDNNSIDDTGRKLKTQNSKLKTKGFTIQIFYQEKNLGFTGGNNIGIQHALKKECEYVYLLNPDTVVTKNFLTEVVRIAQSDKNIATVQSLLLYHDKKETINSAGGRIHFLGFGHTIGNLTNASTSYKLLATSYEIAFPSGAGVLIQTEFLQSIDLLCDDFFSYYEDADLGWKALLSGKKNVLAPQSIVYHKYNFKKSVQSYYFMERNRYLLIFQNYKILTLLLFLPALVITEILMLAKSFTTKYWIERLKVYNYLTNLENWKKIHYNRKATERLRKARDADVLKYFSGTLEYQELGGVPLNVFNIFSKIYFQILRKIIFW